MGFFKKMVQPIVNNARGKAGERKVNSKLNPLIFDATYNKTINNLMLVDRYGNSHQIDHVEIRSNGIFCIETKNYSGIVYGDEEREKWVQVLGSLKHEHNNPIRQNKSHIRQLERVLGSGYKVNSLIVMVQNNADKIDVPYVVNLDDLKKYLADYNDGTKYNRKQIDGIYETLKAAASRTVSSREHVKGIKENQKKIDKGICPRCNGKLVLRNGRNGEFYGCSNYPNCKFTVNK